MAYPERDMEML